MFAKLLFVVVAVTLTVADENATTHGPEKDHEPQDSWLSGTWSSISNAWNGMTSSVTGLFTYSGERLLQ